MKTGLISEASGSAYVESGKIKLSAGVYATIIIPSNHFVYHEKFIHVGFFIIMVGTGPGRPRAARATKNKPGYIAT